MTDMVYGARVNDDGPDGQYIVLDSDEGTRSFRADMDALEELNASLQPLREFWAERDAVKAEFDRAGGVSWDAYRDGLACHSPESDWIEHVRETADLMRKRDREGAMCDPGDISDAA